MCFYESVSSSGEFRPSSVTKKVDFYAAYEYLLKELRTHFVDFHH